MNIYFVEINKSSNIRFIWIQEAHKYFIDSKMHDAIKMHWNTTLTGYVYYDV